MIIAVYGGAGRTGRRVVGLALERGDRVQALVRDASRVAAHPRLRSTIGDARHADDVAAVLKDADVVCCCLGLADISRATTEFSDAVTRIVGEMQSRGPKRIVAIASAAVLPDASGRLRCETAPGGPYRHVNAEHARNFATLARSGLDWTLLCPVDLVDDIPAGHARTAFEALPDGSGVTGYDDLAATMLSVANDPGTFGKRVGVVSVRPEGD